MHPVITIFCAFTRRWALEQWLSDLDKLKHDPALTNLCITVDCDTPFIADTLKQYAKRLGYRSFHSIVNDDHEPSEVRLAMRRPRIAFVKNQSKEMIGECEGDIIIGLEDDTVFGDMDIMRLVQPLLDYSQVAFVEGVQCGRWGVKMIGAWKVDVDSNPKHIETMLPSDEVYEDIHGGGFYGYATRKSLYLDHEYYSASSQPWGPDVNYGLWLRQQGYTLMIDWRTIFGHNDYGKILYPVSDNTGRLEKVTFTKEPQNGKWKRQDIPA